MADCDIASLRRLLENAEHNDAEAHKLYNNLGLAYAAKHDYRNSLKAHREEKKICKRLLEESKRDTTRHLDLAIAYRRCGDTMLKLDRVIDIRGKVISRREEVIKLAQAQHRKGYEYANQAPIASKQNQAAVRLEKQAASAALAQSTLALALCTHKRQHFVKAAMTSFKAARQAQNVVVGYSGLSHNGKQSLLLGIALNQAIALSELGEKSRARTLLQAVAVRANELDDQANLVRALSNLGEEASREGEWELCATYTREWARISRHEEDAPDESDALRKLAVALRETGDLTGAEEALQRALSLHTSEEALNEARTFLKVVQQEIEEVEKAQFEYSSLQRKAEAAKNEGDYAEEAKLRLKCGNCAFILRKTEKVVEILTRYFELVDNFGCDPVLTEVEESMHNAAIANMGESLWKLKRLEEAVKWATRELSVYDGDPPGQAQAWCNLGVYLDDLGRKEKAMDALRQSINIARKCGETDTMKRAEDNLFLVEQEFYAKGGDKHNDFDGGVTKANSSGSGRAVDNHLPNDDDPDIVEVTPRAAVSTVAMRNGRTPPTRSSGGCASSGRRNSGSAQKRKLDDSNGLEDDAYDGGDGVCIDSNFRGSGDSRTPVGECAGEKSIIMVSTQAMKKSKLDNGANARRHANGVESSYDMRHSCASTTKRSLVQHGSASYSGSDGGTRYSGEQSVSMRTRDYGDENGGPRVLKNLVDLAREYRAICAKTMTSRHGSVGRGKTKDQTTTGAKSKNQGRSRLMIINAFRELSSGLLSLEACDQIHTPLVSFNISGLMLDNDDVAMVFETLAMIPREFEVAVDLSFNPVVNGSAYTRKLASPYVLHVVKQLDLSCAGVSADTVRRLSEPLSEHGALGQVVNLNLSKNSLGRFGRSTATAVARLISHSSKLVMLDLSLNLLPNTFLTDLWEGLGTVEAKGKIAATPPQLQTLNLSLNNRRAPTGLLETVATQLISDAFVGLFEIVGTLETVNVRACGASLSMRRALRQLNETMADSPRCILTVSDENLEEDH